MRVGVRDVAAETFAAENDDETVFFHRLDEDFDARDFDVFEEFNDFDRFFRRNAARATVGDEAVFVDRAEVATDADVVRADRERDAGGFENAATDLEDERIVTEEAEVARAAAGGNARENREGHTGNALGGELIEIRRRRGFQFGRPARLQRKTADTVRNDHNDFTAFIGFEGLNQLVQFHFKPFVFKQTSN